MSRKKTSGPEDPFASIPPRETFDAFPSLSAFPENAIAFLTGKATEPEPSGSVALQVEVKPLTQPVTKQATQTDSPSDGQSAPDAAVQTAAQPTPQPDSQTEALTLSPSEDPSTGPSTPPTASPSARQTRSQTKDLSEGLSRGLPKPAPPSPTPSPTPSLTTDQTASQSLGLLRISDRLNANQRRVLDLLLAVKPYIIKFRDIADALDMREASVRTILRRLESLSFLSFGKARDGNIQGIRVAFNQQVIEQYQKDLTISHTASPAPGQPQSPVWPGEQSRTPSLSPNPFRGQPDSRPDNPSASQTAPQEIDRKENLSIEENLGWDDQFLELMWPRVHEAGFRVEQVGQAMAAREKLGKRLEREMVALSLDRADWEIEEKGCLVDVASGEKVRNPAAYIFTALARWGMLRAHPEYVSREEKEASGAAAEVRRRREAAEAVEAARFEAWLSGLSPEARTAAMVGFPGGSREAWLKKHWRAHIREA